jgi:hypothetical protein
MAIFFEPGEHGGGSSSQKRARRAHPLSLPGEQMTGLIDTILPQSRTRDPAARCFPTKKPLRGFGVSAVFIQYPLFNAAGETDS